MIDHTATIIAKLIVAGIGFTLLTFAFSWMAAVGFACLLAVFTYELRSGKDR